MIIDNKENNHVVGVGFTAYEIHVNIGVKTATKKDVYKRQVYARSVFLKAHFFGQPFKVLKAKRRKKW